MSSMAWTRALAFAAALTGAILVAAVALRPPGDRDNGFSTAAAMKHVRVIATRPHPIGSPENTAVRRYLLEEFDRLAMETEIQPFAVSAKPRARLRQWGAPWADTAVGANIVGVLPGSERDLPAVAIMAHYDSVWASPGAADDAAGVAAALEVARVVKTRGPHRRDLVLVFTDGEELGLLGARAFFANNALAGRIGVVINLEARGAAGRAGMFETGKGNRRLMRLFARSVEAPTAHSLAMLVYELLPNDTDFTIAKAAGMPGFNFAILGDPGLYHSPLATPNRLDRGALRHLGQQTLDLVPALDTAPSFARSEDNLVFSDLFGRGLIAYPSWVGWFPVILAGVALFVIVKKTRTRRRPRQVRIGFALTIALIVATGVLLFAANRLSGAGAGSNYYDRLAATGWLEIQAFALCLGLLFLAPRKLTGLWSGWIGLLGIGLTITIFAQGFIPAAAPLVAWPLLAASLTALGLAYFDPELKWDWTPVILCLPLAVFVGFVFYWGHILFLGVGQQLPMTMAIIAFLAMTLLWPLLQRLPGRQALIILGLALILTGGAVALKVRFDPLSPMAATY